MTEKGN